MNLDRYRIIGGYQAVLGGIVAAGSLALPFLTPGDRPVAWALPAMMGLFGLLVFGAGFLVWKRKPFGLTLSLVLQGLVMIDFQTPYMGWSMFLSAPGFVSFDFNFNIYLERILQGLGVASPPSPLVLGIDIPAAILFGFLWRMRREQKRRAAAADAGSPAPEEP